MKAALIKIGLVFILSAPAICQSSEQINAGPDFKSDGCSLFPDGDYRNCCVEHDKAYYVGGSSKERRIADNRLHECVRAKGHKFLAPVIWIGVRIGGVPFLPTPFRWGFGRTKLKDDIAKPPRAFRTD